MAVSNAIGSNVFDVNLGLGLPFLIRIAIQAGAPFKLFSDDSAVCCTVIIRVHLIYKINACCTLFDYWCL